MSDETADTKRDKLLRAKLLLVLFLVRGTSITGRINGRQLKHRVEEIAGDGAFDDDTHALALMRDLDAAGLAEEKIRGLRENQRFTLDHAEYGITTAGVALHTQASVKHPLVWDDRVEAE